MNQSTNSENHSPEIRSGRKISKVWIIPVLGLFLGVWLVKQRIAEKGEFILVTFENAEGLQVDKTDVRCRSVAIGKVESITLDPDDLSVEVGLRIKPDHVSLVRSGAKFWVVRPRVSGSSVSGLGTLISGSYIELDPGPDSDGESQKTFVGEEQPPLTPSSIPGLRLTLKSSSPGAIDLGSGVYFMGNPVGKVESRNFDPQSKTTDFGIFIDEKFSLLVHRESRFWQDSGVELEVGTSGFDLNLPSLDSLFAGRIHFGTPDGVSETGPISANSEQFDLYENRETAEASAFKSAGDLLLLLEQSVRGLNAGAPVEFRGLRVGRVKTISYQLIENSSVEKTPVLIQLNEHLLNKHFPASFRDEGDNGLQAAFDNGLRASIKSSNLLTGQMYVDLDYYPKLKNEGIGLVQQGDHVILPTVETGFNLLEDKVDALLAKLTDLDLDSLLQKAGKTADQATIALANVNKEFESNKGVISDAKKTLQEITKAVGTMNELLADDDSKQLSADLRTTLAKLNASLEPLSNDGAIYGDLRRTLDEFRSAFRSIEKMTNEISDKPNSLIFGKDPRSRLTPRARKR